MNKITEYLLIGSKKLNDTFYVFKKLKSGKLNRYASDIQIESNLTKGALKFKAKNKILRNFFHKLLKFVLSEKRRYKWYNNAMANIGVIEDINKNTEVIISIFTFFTNFNRDTEAFEALSIVSLVREKSISDGKTTQLYELVMTENAEQKKLKLPFPLKLHSTDKKHMKKVIAFTEKTILQSIAYQLKFMKSHKPLPGEWIKIDN